MASRFSEVGSRLRWCLAMLWLWSAAASAATLSFTVNATEAVVVTGTPRIAIDVGGVTRYATYVSGSGTNVITFGYQVQAGDFDANGIALVSPLQLNGGIIADVSGNSLADLSFAVPDTASLKVQTYTAAFSGSITNANANAVSFVIAKAPADASFTYTITSSGGSGSVTGSGTIASSPHTVSGVDVSALPFGTLTLSVTVSTPAGGTGAARSATASAGFTGVLDGLAASSAWSTRRLGSVYTGPLLRVRRAADNAEQDIGATLGGGLDAAALTSFCGGDSCYVRTWYDQSGNGRDATQGTASAQPRIVNAGVLETVNNRPALKGNDTNVQMVFALGPLVNFPISVNLVLAKTSTSERGAWVKLGSLLPGAGGIAIGVGTSPFLTSYGQNLLALKENIAWVPSPAILASSAVVTYTQDGTANTTNIYQNGSAINIPNGLGAPYPPSGMPGYSNTTGYLFGHTYFNGQQRWSVNPISEVILLPAILSTSERQAVERNQGSYYGITVQ